MTRNTIELFNGDGDRAVSPVIGVILMVAITVILAAVIGTFVLGLGQEVSNTTPQASITFTGGTGEVTLTHEGGDQIPSEVTMTVDGNTEGTLSSPLDPGETSTISSTTTGNDLTVRLVDNATGNMIAKGTVDIS